MPQRPSAGRAGPWGEPQRRLRLERSERLFRLGDPVRWLYVVERGRLRLERTSVDGTAVILATAQPGDTVAVASLSAERYHCDAVAEVAGRVARFDRAAVLAAIRGDPAQAEAVIRDLSHEVRRLRALLELRSVHPAGERVLSYLRIRELLSGDAPDRPLRAIAAEIGLSPETLYRTLAELERAKRIERQGRRIWLKT